MFSTIILKKKLPERKGIMIIFFVFMKKTRFFMNFKVAKQFFEFLLFFSSSNIALKNFCVFKKIVFCVKAILL